MNFIKRIKNYVISKRLKIKVYKNLEEIFTPEIISEQDIAKTIIDIYTWENWINGGCKESPELTNLSKQYNLLFKNQTPEVYNIYRQEMFLKAMNSIGYGLIYNTIWDIFYQIKKQTPDELEKYISFQKIDENGITQRSNNWRKMKELQKIERGKNIPFYIDNYKDYFEIDQIYYRLAQLNELINKKKFAPNPFDKTCFDKNNRLLKGRVVNEIFPQFFAGTKINSVLKETYNVKLRNMSGHNDYKINESRKFIESLVNGYEISFEEIMLKLNHIIHINNALWWVLSRNEYYDNLKNYADRGCIAFGYANGKLPVAFIIQLEVFENIDYDKKWLNNITFEYKDQKVFVFVSENRYPIIIPENPYFNDWYNLLKGKECSCVILPVLLPLGVSGKGCKIDDILYELTRDMKIKIIKII
ncbi:MAG: hypothetical protein WC947_10680 [Elusimicrobiota bacterium]